MLLVALRGCRMPACRVSISVKHATATVRSRNRQQVSFRIDHLPRHTAIDDELGASDEPAFGAHQERRQSSDVVRRADASGGMEHVVLRAWRLTLGEYPAGADA